MGGWTLASKNDIRAKHISVADLCVTFFFFVDTPHPLSYSCAVYHFFHFPDHILYLFVALAVEDLWVGCRSFPLSIIVYPTLSRNAFSRPPD